MKIIHSTLANLLILFLSVIFFLPSSYAEDRNNRGLQIRGLVGGYEPDYTKSGYEAMLFYDGFNNLDLHAGYSFSDQVYYTRDKIYADGYFFYRPYSYLKLYLAMKDYDYPDDATLKRPNPDSSAYDRVPTIEMEVSHWLTKTLRGTLAYEYFRPDFFYDKDTSAENQKISAEIYYKPKIDFLRAKLFYALLKDPDPDTTEIKGRDNLKTPAGIAAGTDIHYRSSSLLGGGLEYVKDRWDIEMKYIPNRDLDNSYQYSILTGIKYELKEDLSVRLDHVYDTYSSKSSLSGETANVYMVSAYYALTPRIDLGAGYKYIDIPRGIENTGFFSLAYKTGLRL